MRQVYFYPAFAWKCSVYLI